MRPFIPAFLIAVACNDPKPITVRFVDNATAPPNRIDMPVEPRPQPDRPLDIILGTRGADPALPFVPRIVAKANGKIGLNVADPEADLDIKADTIKVNGATMGVSLPQTTVDVRGPVTLGTDMAVKLGGRVVISPPAHTWLHEGFEVDLHNTNGAPGPGPAGFNVGAFLSADRGAGPKPYIGFRSQGPSPEDVRLNLSNTAVHVWSKQADGTWWPNTVSLFGVDKTTKEQAPVVQQHTADIAALKSNRPRVTFGQGLGIGPHAGQFAWCTRAAGCCQWRLESPCPAGYSVLSGGCYFDNSGWVPGRALASISYNAPSSNRKAWTCEARLADNCVEVTFHVRSICISDNTFGH